MRVLLASSLLLATACSPLPNPLDGPCSSLDVDAVEDAAAAPANVAVKVRVTCDGRALGRRLDASAFELAEDGLVLSAYEAERAITPIARDASELVLIALDLSGSVTRSGLRDELLVATRALIGALDPSQEVAIYGFDGRAELVPFSGFTAERAATEAALARVQDAPTVDDSTNLYGAVVDALELLDGELGKRMGLVHGTLVTFTDGTDRAGRVARRDVEGAMLGTDHATFAIGVGAELDEEVLSLIGQTGQVIARDTTALAPAFADIGAKVRASAETDYLVSYCSPARAGSRTLTVMVRQGDQEDDAEVSFSAEGFGPGCSPMAPPL
jgi:hypothetical protein